MKTKILSISLLLALTGCSSCKFVFDIGPGKGYCYAAKAQEKHCKDRGGKMQRYSISPFRFACADGTVFKGHGNGYPLNWEIENGAAELPPL